MAKNNSSAFQYYLLFGFSLTILIALILFDRDNFYQSKNGVGLGAGPNLLINAIITILNLSALTGTIWTLKKIFCANANRLQQIFGIFIVIILSLAITFQPIQMVDQANQPLAFQKITITKNLICDESPCNAESYKLFEGYTFWNGLVFLPSSEIDRISHRRGLEFPFYSFEIPGYQLPIDQYFKQTTGSTIQMYQLTAN